MKSIQLRVKLKLQLWVNGRNHGWCFGVLDERHRRLNRVVLVDLIRWEIYFLDLRRIVDPVTCGQRNRSDSWIRPLWFPFQSLGKIIIELRDCLSVRDENRSDQLWHISTTTTTTASTALTGAHIRFDLKLVAAFYDASIAGRCQLIGLQIHRDRYTVRPDPLRTT